MTKLNKFLCWLGIHYWTVFDHYLFRVSPTRDVYYGCPHCGKYIKKEYRIATEPDNRFK